MRHRSASAMALVTLVSALAVACGDDESGGVAAVTRETFPASMASAICGKRDACACDADPACRATLERRYLEEAAYLEEQGLTYDPACGGRAVGQQSSITCDGFWTDPVCQPCSVFHGAVPDGGACLRIPAPTGDLYDDCAPGLTCSTFNDRCIPKCPGPGDYCDGSNWCGEDAYCTDAAGGICLRYTAVGGVCEAGYECVTGNCVAGTCQDYPAIGEPCDGVCQGDAVCVAGLCAAGGRQGAACQSNYSCAEGFYCALDQTCQPQKLKGEQCPLDPPDPCARGLVCTEGACAPFPANICPT